VLQVAARWRPRWRAGLQSQVREDPLDHGCLQDGGDDRELATAVRAVFKVDLLRESSTPKAERFM